MNEAPLVLRVELGSGLPRPAGTVVFDNRSSAAVRVWRTGNEWGDTALRFEVTAARSLRRIIRQPQVYTRHVPSFVSIAPGTQHAWPFDLGDGEWQTGARLDEVLVPGVRLVAVYEVTPSPEAAAHQVWVGRLKSAPVVLQE